MEKEKRMNPAFKAYQQFLHPTIPHWNYFTALITLANIKFIYLQTYKQPCSLLTGTGLNA
jgi:hypothetical protein